jgi:hypothetical protein
MGRYHPSKNMLHISMEFLRVLIIIVFIFFLGTPINFRFVSVLGVIAPLLPKTSGKT